VGRWPFDLSCDLGLQKFITVDAAGEFIPSPKKLINDDGKLFNQLRRMLMCVSPGSIR
jgi:hypothetical protein